LGQLCRIRSAFNRFAEAVHPLVELVVGGEITKVPKTCSISDQTNLETVKNGQNPVKTF
jgi:hypothetical protein